VVAFTKYVAQELGPYGITANAVAPGMTATDVITNLPAKHKQQVLAMTPLGHIARSEEIAGVIAFFADDDSGFMTGTCAPVNVPFSSWFKP
jgi:3-oxoacyl-[acyl-carrier protein] reductase